MLKLYFLLVLLCSGSIWATAQVVSPKIKVLNVGMFHLAGTHDAHKIDYDPATAKSRQETQQLAALLADFKPTVLCVERVPEETGRLQAEYDQFLKDSTFVPRYGGEIGLVVFPMGRLAKASKIYGIDEQEVAAYNYGIAEELGVDISEYLQEGMTEFLALDSLSTLDKIRALNTPHFHELLIHLNADILTYVATAEGTEGADEAAKFYQRNLRIYAHLNKLPLEAEDRVCIIMGATHTAFLQAFLARSPRYEVVDVSTYLGASTRK